MKKKYIIIIIGIITLLFLLMVLYFNSGIKYNNLIVSYSNWSNIKNYRAEDNNLKIDSISFNDYPVIIDQNNNIMYYNMINSVKGTNPIISYKSKDKLKIAINNKLDLENNIEIMFYNDSYYRTYKLKVLNNSIVSIEYRKISVKPEDAEVLIIDNNNKSTQKIIKSMATIKNSEQERYFISLKKESLGRNRRKNELSILGMDVGNEFVLQKDSNQDNNYMVSLFLNNEYQGNYILEHNNSRRKGE